MQLNVTHIRTEITVISAADFKLEKSIYSCWTTPISGRSDVNSPGKHDESVSAEWKSNVFIRWMFPFSLHGRFSPRCSLLTPVAFLRGPPEITVHSPCVWRSALFDSLLIGVTLDKKEMGVLLGQKLLLSWTCLLSCAPDLQKIIKSVRFTWSSFEKHFEVAYRHLVCFCCEILAGCCE